MVFIFVWERIIPFASSLQNGGSERVEVHISFVLVRGGIWSGWLKMGLTAAKMGHWMSEEAGGELSYSE